MALQTPSHIFPARLLRQVNTVSTLQGVVINKPLFSQPGGLFEDSLYLTLTSPDINEQVHYTLDGSDPTPASPVFTAPIFIKNRKCGYECLFHDSYLLQSPFCCLTGIHLLENVFKATVVRAFSLVPQMVIFPDRFLRIPISLTIVFLKI
ncbi:MAG: chitobiase/beta-hexosaminidase C-terminal domain-containing protein [Bacteroidetes bacterium]|nr:chitobiase/beta-hexosaminidase C-terminal domain-containing protein [Bacteroidota bacterium]